MCVAPFRLAALRRPIIAACAALRARAEPLLPVNASAPRQWLLACPLPQRHEAQPALQECKHGTHVPETRRLVATWLFQRSAPYRLPLAVPRAPHAQHVGQIACVEVVVCF